MTRSLFRLIFAASFADYAPKSPPVPRGASVCNSLWHPASFAVPTVVELCMRNWTDWARQRARRSNCAAAADITTPGSSVLRGQLGACGEGIASIAQEAAL